MKQKSIVVCTGLKRSGSTLQFNIAREIFNLKSSVKNIGFLSEPEVTTTIERIVKEKNYSSTNYILKSHRIDIKTLKSYSEYLKVIHIYRDLRDVYLSCKDKFNEELNHFIGQTPGLLNYYMKVESLPFCLSQSYEEVYQKRQGIIDVASFLGFKLNKKEVDAIQNKVSLSSANSITSSFSIKNRILIILNNCIPLIPTPIRGFTGSVGLNSFVRRKIIPQSIYDSESLLHHDHISKRKGAIGTWKENLSDKEITSIQNNFEEWMNKKGYL
jgi:hypothetical protein